MVAWPQGGGVLIQGSRDPGAPAVAPAVQNDLLFEGYIAHRLGPVSKLNRRLSGRWISLTPFVPGVGRGDHIEARRAKRGCLPSKPGTFITSDAEDADEGQSRHPRPGCG